MLNKSTKPRKVLGVIPARMKSTRFPGKSIYPIMGKPMLQHVFEHAMLCDKIDHLVIATDSIEIKNKAQRFHADVCMTSSLHRTGLDRLIEVKTKMNEYNIFVNIQGDEPLVHAETIAGVIQILQGKDAKVSSSAAAFQNYQDFIDPNNVKVVLDQEDAALYFSRSPIPYTKRRIIPQGALKHQGLYAYTREALDQISQLAPSQIEETEQLEQIRMLYHKMKIFIHRTTHDSIGVDHPEDIRKVESIIKKSNG